MVGSLHYFLHADPAWTREHLITPLIADNAEALALWRAIARSPQYREVLQIIGGPMAERTNDMRLGRETRQSLVFSIVVESLHALNEKRTPAVPFSRVQQMIRSLDDEVREYGAGVIQRFVRDLSRTNSGAPIASTPEVLFQQAASPFLEEVWPQERSLATPGVSRALADLPATARGAFAEGVSAIERFLVPFECWSMMEYGLYGEDDKEPRLSMIDDEKRPLRYCGCLIFGDGSARNVLVLVRQQYEQCARPNEEGGAALVRSTCFPVVLAAAARRS